MRRLAAVAVAAALVALVAAVPPARLEPVVRTVDDVAPALRNATTIAVAGAQTILSSYSDLLIAVAIRECRAPLYCSWSKDCKR